MSFAAVVRRRFSRLFLEVAPDESAGRCVTLRNQLLVWGRHSHVTSGGS
jgi:hypothetical protein